MRYILTTIVSLLLIYSTSLRGQNRPEDHEQVRKSNAQVNTGRLLLEAARDGKIQMVRFDQFGGEAEEIQVANISVANTNFSMDEWESSMIYFLGDPVQYNGLRYESLVDNNEEEPGVSDNWQLYEEVWEEIDNINSYYTGDNGSSDYFHLYFQFKSDIDSSIKYLASFRSSEVIDHLNSTGLIWYQTGENGHLTGSIFLSNSNAIFLKSANLAGVEISEEDLSFEDRTEKWWAMTRNFSLKENDTFRFHFEDDSIMWELPASEVRKISGSEDSEFYLLGDAFASGKAFDGSITPTTSLKQVEQIQSNILEDFTVLKEFYPFQNGQRSDERVSTTGINMDDWTNFIEMVIKESKNGNLTPYTSADLKQKLSEKDFDLRLMINEEEAADLQFEQDQWNKNVVYYFGDKAEYAGILYESTQDNNEDHIPVQWPEYWQEVVLKVDYFYPDELRNVKVKSELVFDPSGKILSISPASFGLEVPSSFLIDSDLNKEIAWFKLDEIPESSDPVFNRIIKRISDHDFYAELLHFEPLQIMK